MTSYLRKFKSKFGDANDKIILFNVIGAFGIKGAALVVSLITMPGYIRYFDNHQILGLWFTLLSVLIWILTFDFGIGNGLRNRLVKSLIENDQEKTKKYISSSYISVGLISLVSTLVGLYVFQFINWNLVFNISKEVVPLKKLHTVVNIIFLSIMVQFFLKLITSILYAMQKSALNNFLALLSSIILLIYVSIANFTNNSNNLILLSIVYFLSVNIPLLFSTLIIFNKQLKGLKPEIKYFDFRYAKDIAQLGGSFFWIQIMYMIITATNDFLISFFSGPEEVVEYQIYNKLFTFIGTFFMLALTPVWSAVTKAIVEKNYIWIKKIYKNLKKIAFLAMLIQFILIIFLQFLADLWLGKDILEINYIYAFIFALFGNLLIWNGVVSSIANGCGELKTQSIYFSLGAFLKIPIAWFLVNLFDSWIGVIIANILALSLYCIIQPIRLNRILNEYTGGE